MKTGLWELAKCLFWLCVVPVLFFVALAIPPIGFIMCFAGIFMFWNMMGSGRD